MKIDRCEPASRRDRYASLALLAAWAAAVLFFASRHVFWRDEVRAFTIALSGDNVAGMLRALHGEGHPALWYLLLRGAHDIIPVREVLPVVAGLIAAAAMAILVLRSPFRPAVIALILFGEFGLFEYAVIARNYGITMLVLFALAALYPRYRDRGVTIGCVLALLCNTNVPATFFAAALLLFWLCELVSEDGLRWTARYRLFALNAAVAAVGALLCFLEVYPTVNDAAVTRHPGGIGLQAIADAAIIPAYGFWELVPHMIPPNTAVAALLGILIFGSVLGLIRAPGAFASTLITLVLFELFSRFVYPSSYRHQALFLVYVIAMYWLVAKGRGGWWPERWRVAERTRLAAVAGRAMFVALLAMQVINAAILINADLSGIPNSRARDLASVLRREHLLNAILIGDPEMFLEPLPYYVANPIYLMREQRFGSVVRFTRNVRRDLSLNDYLDDARLLQSRSAMPVVIVLQQRLDAAKPPMRLAEGYVWTFSTDPSQVRRFLAATRRIARFGPTATDETYDVYLLKASAPALAAMNH